MAANLPQLLMARRFCSEKLLPCNCGAVRCRGFVNAPERDITQAAIIWAPSTEVQAWTGIRSL